MVGTFQPLPSMVKTSRSSYLRPHEEREQAERRDFWRKLTVRCVLADLKHHKPVDPELAEWAKANAGEKWSSR